MNNLSLIRYEGVGSENYNAHVDAGFECFTRLGKGVSLRGV
jgi:hypothetical protein